MTLPLRTERLPCRRRGRAAVAALLGVSLLGGLAAQADAAPRKKRHAAKTFNVQLLAINDFHGHIEPPKLRDGLITTGYTTPTPTNPTGAVQVEAGGVAYLAAHIRRLKATSRHNVVVAAGDLIGGSPAVSGVFHDEPAVEALNKVGLELSSVGNHEFDDGSTELLRMQYGGCHPVDGCQDGDGYRGADFQWLAANVAHATDDNKPNYDDTLLPPTAIRTFRGVKIGFIGMTLEGTPSIVKPSGILGLDFLDEAATANRWARHLKRRGAEAIVVLLHEGAMQTGLYNECKDASGPLVDIVNRMDDEIDVVVSGHTHRSYICKIDGKLVTSGESYGRLVTDIDLTIDRRSRDILRAKAGNVVVTRDDVEPAPDLTALVSKYVTLAEPLLNRVIGQVTATITRAPNTALESALGDVIADAQLAATAAADQGGAQIAFMNPGGIRGDLPGPPEGDANITYGEAFTVQPFGNNLVTINLTGAQIEQLLEAQWLGQPFPRVLQVSAGFSYAWSLSAPAGAKVDPASITLNGVPIDPAANYRVTVNSFLADGGDNFVILREGTDRLGGVVDLDALEAYLAAAEGPIAPGPQNRITVLP